MAKMFTLYSDQLKRLLAQVEANVQKNPLAIDGIMIAISDEDKSVKVFQKISYDWIYLNDEKLQDYYEG